MSKLKSRPLLGQISNGLCATQQNNPNLPFLHPILQLREEVVVVELPDDLNVLEHQVCSVLVDQLACLLLCLQPIKQPAGTI